MVRCCQSAGRGVGAVDPGDDGVGDVACSTCEPPVVESRHSVSRALGPVPLTSRPTTIIGWTSWCSSSTSMVCGTAPAANQSPPAPGLPCTR